MNKAREKLIEQLLSVLKEDKIPFSSKWISSQKNINAITNKEYRSINQLILSFSAAERNLNDPRWCTFVQAKNNNWKVNKGAKGVPIEYWILYDKVQKKEISITEANTLIEKDEAYQENIKAVSKIYTVFNAEEISGIPLLEKKKIFIDSNSSIFAENVLNKYLKNEGIKISFDGHRAYYNILEDSIQLPNKEKFYTMYDYLSVLSHEICHSTGNKNRLNRNIGNRILEEEKYAVEELRAEIGSCFLCSELRIEYSDHDIQNHKSYIQSWIQLIHDAPMELFRAINNSQEIADFVLERGDYVLMKEQAESVLVTNDIGVRERMTLAIQETKKSVKPIDKELFSGENLNGAGLYYEDLQVALATGKDLDGIDIPNDKPEEINSKLIKYDEPTR